MFVLRSHFSLTVESLHAITSLADSDPFVSASFSTRMKCTAQRGTQKVFDLKPSIGAFVALVLCKLDSPPAAARARAVFGLPELLRRLLYIS